MDTLNGLVGYVYDDGGRQAAGYKGKAGDCVPRACSILLGDNYAPAGARYREIYREMADANGAVKGGKGKRSARDGVHKSAYERVFAAYDIVKVKLPKGPRPTYTEAYERYGNCIVSTAKHIAAVIRGNYRDTYDDRTYVWKALYCSDCEPLDRECVGSGIGNCEVCGNRTAGGLFKTTRERKAQSVYVLGPSWLRASA